MADELARAYFEKLKAAEQQIFELQLELTAKSNPSSNATTVALQQRISVLEKDNARLRDVGGDDEQFRDEVEEDDEETQVVMCDCGVDLLAQMQENRTLQNELKTERLKFQVIQGQVKNLRKQVSERDEKISNLIAQNVVTIKQEPAEVSAGFSAKRKRTDADLDLFLRAGNTGGQPSIPSKMPDYRQHPSRAALTGHIDTQRPNPSPMLPTPAQTPNPAQGSHYLHAVPSPLVENFASHAPSCMQRSVLRQTNSIQSMPSLTISSRQPPLMSSFVKASNTAQMSATHPDRVKLVREEPRVPKQVLESPASPQDSSTESELDDDDGPTAINVKGFPNNWRLPLVKKALSDLDIPYLIVRRPQ